MILKVKSPTIMPGLENVKDEGSKEVFKDINKIVQETVRDISDDLHNLYEEGDWTAAFACGTSGTITIDSSYKTGRYVKIGNMVTVTGDFRVNSVSSPVGDFNLTGLPFKCGNGDKFSAGVSIWVQGLEATATTTMLGEVIKNTTYMTITHFTAGVSAAAAADVKAGAEIMISATYFTE